MPVFYKLEILWYNSQVDFSVDLVGDFMKVWLPQIEYWNTESALVAVFLRMKDVLHEAGYQSDTFDRLVNIVAQCFPGNSSQNAGLYDPDQYAYNTINVERLRLEFQTSLKKELARIDGTAKEKVQWCLLVPEIEFELASKVAFIKQLRGHEFINIFYHSDYSSDEDSSFLAEVKRKLRMQKNIVGEIKEEYFPEVCGFPEKIVVVPAPLGKVVNLPPRQRQRWDDDWGDEYYDGRPDERRWAEQVAKIDDRRPYDEIWEERNAKKRVEDEINLDFNPDFDFDNTVKEQIQIKKEEVTNLNNLIDNYSPGAKKEVKPEVKTETKPITDLRYFLPKL